MSCGVLLLLFVAFYFCFLWHFTFAFCGVARRILAMREGRGRWVRGSRVQKVQKSKVLDSWKKYLGENLEGMNKGVTFAKKE